MVSGWKTQKSRLRWERCGRGEFKSREIYLTFRAVVILLDQTVGTTWQPNWLQSQVLQKWLLRNKFIDSHNKRTCWRSVWLHLLQDACWIKNRLVETGVRWCCVLVLGTSQIKGPELTPVDLEYPVPACNFSCSTLNAQLSFCLFFFFFFLGCSSSTASTSGSGSTERDELRFSSAISPIPVVTSRDEHKVNLNSGIAHHSQRLQLSFSFSSFSRRRE